MISRRVFLMAGTALAAAFALRGLTPLAWAAESSPSRSSNLMPNGGQPSPTTSTGSFGTRTRSALYKRA